MWIPSQRGCGWCRSGLLTRPTSRGGLGGICVCCVCCLLSLVGQEVSQLLSEILSLKYSQFARKTEIDSQLVRLVSYSVSVCSPTLRDGSVGTCRYSINCFLTFVG